MTPRARRLASPLAIGGLAVAATVALRLRDPHQRGAWGFCPTQLLTDLDCPLCGGLRAVNDLTHLDVASALSSNIIVVVAIPLVLLFWLRRLVACWRGGEAMRPLAISSWVWVVGLTVLGAFTLARNLPGSWLAA